VATDAFSIPAMNVFSLTGRSMRMSRWDGEALTYKFLLPRRAWYGRIDCQSIEKVVLLKNLLILLAQWIFNNIPHPPPDSCPLFERFLSMK
jgi:hypothetical protein